MKLTINHDSSGIVLQILGHCLNKYVVMQNSGGERSNIDLPGRVILACLTISRHPVANNPQYLQ